jgi:NADH-quinone oxidoreductase subunit M
MPGTPGFDAAHLMLEAAIDTFRRAVDRCRRARQRRRRRLPALGLPARLPEPGKTGGHDVDRTMPMEYLVCGIALAAMLAIGFFTEPWLRLTETASQAMAGEIRAMTDAATLAASFSCRCWRRGGAVLWLLPARAARI